MPDYSRFVDIISGQNSGLWPAAVRGLLSCLTPAYRLAVWLRNRRFDRGQGVTVAGALVLSVGNLTTGGTGKTPFVIWLANQLSRVTQVAIISRGYGARIGELNDEGLEIQLFLSEVPLLQHPDRVRSARQAIRQFGIQAIVLDDGFQHRALARDLDIVLIDATAPFGYDRLLPRGLLREPVSSLRRADVAVLTRSNLVSPQTREDIRQRVMTENPGLTWVETRTRVTGWMTHSGKLLPIEELFQKKTFVCCGIGNPNGFLATLKRAGMQVTDHKFFGDHHPFSGQDLIQVRSLARQSGCQAIVCTLKDLVKIRRHRLDGMPLYALATEIEFTSGLELLQERIDDLLRGLSSETEKLAAESGGEIAA